MQVLKSSLVVVAIFGVALPALAQTRTGGTNTSGMFGSRNMGGGTSFGSMGGGTGAGAGGAAGNSAAGAALTGGERFLEQNRRGAFVGADSGDTANARGSLTNTRGGMSGLQGMFGNQGMFSQMNRMQQLQGNQNQGRNNQQLRIRLTMGGATPNVRSAPPARITNGFQVRLRRLPALQLVTPIEVVADGPVLVLRGEVASEGDRQMVEDLAMLEPEVTQVRNEIVVREAALPAEALPAPTSASRSSAP
jgi:osmotically-inducible protein OsmY